MEQDTDAVRQYIEEQAIKFRTFTGIQRPRPNDVFILVMGMTGSGKSSFVASCTGKVVTVGHGLQSCTSDIDIFDFEFEGRQVFLIDTPGFNDTKKSDAETLATVSTYLGTSYAQNVFIHGILYLHRITDNRVSGSAKRNFEMFRALCGEASYANVSLITTMWTDKGRKDQLRREAELRRDPKFFGSIISGGASLLRHGEYGNDPLQLRDSALSIVRQLIIQCRPGPIVLLIQHELVEEKKVLDDTSAGIIVQADLHRAFADYRKELTNLRHAMSRTAQSSTLFASGEAQEMAELKAEFKRKLDAVERERNVLASNLAWLQQREQETLVSKLKATEKRFESELERQERHLRELQRSLQRAEDDATSKNPLQQTVIRSKLQKEVSNTEEKVMRERQKVHRLKNTVDGVREGILDVFSTSLSSAIVAGGKKAHEALCHLATAAS
ncbi:hypothetical protein PspLS_08118 [Pyricularia sp. CBS 133598]|nr:hypothetical protein PspLS_08118 [Pyricularia sp. CBS 133598]